MGPVKGEYTNVAFIALAIGFDLITKFFSGEIIGLQLQINRHIIMTLYGTIGAIFFIFYPLVKKMIYLKELMLKKQFVDKA